MNLPDVREEGLTLTPLRWVIGAAALGLLGLLLTAWQATTQPSQPVQTSVSMTIPQRVIRASAFSPPAAFASEE